MHVPLVDLKVQYKNIKNEIKKAIEAVLEDQKFIQGEYADKFARDFSKLQGGGIGVGCANGTSALLIALKAIGLQQGDEVITAANSFISTASAIHAAGGMIKLVDVDARSYTMNVDALEKSITPNTKVILPVHLYGNTCNMDKIMEIAKKYKLKVVEECSHAHLAKFSEKGVGLFGDAGAFSFYPSKNLGAYGDAGLILCKTKEIKERVEMEINHGRMNKKFEHEILGANYRMDGIQAAILSAKLPFLEAWTNSRKNLARSYNAALKGRGFKVIESNPQGECVYHHYIVEVSNRSEVVKTLKDSGIETAVHYPVPLHLQPALAFLNYKKGDFPVTEAVAERVLSLPMFPEMSMEQEEYVLTEFFQIAKA